MKANQALAIAIANAKSVAPGAITSAVEDWLDEHVDPDTGYVIDDTLSTTGAAADAKKTGDEIADLKSAKAAKADVLAALFLTGDGWVNVDTNARTITFPADTSIVANDRSGNQYRYNFAEAQTVNLTIDAFSQKIIFNTSTQTLSTIYWSSPIPANCLLIALYNRNEGALEIGCRYKINGRPFGLSIDPLYAADKTLALYNRFTLNPAYGNFDHYGLNADGTFLTSQKYRVSNNDPLTFDFD